MSIIYLGKNRKEKISETDVRKFPSRNENIRRKSISCDLSRISLISHMTIVK